MAEVFLASDADVQRATGAKVGFAGPVGFKGRIVADKRVMQVHDAITGANETDAKYLTATRYTRRVRQVMTRFLSSAPRASCLMLGPMDRRAPKSGEPDRERTRLDLIIDVQRQVADELDCAFIDLKEMMGGADAHKRWQAKGLAQKDGIHLTIPGYRILGELIAERILDAYDRYAEAVPHGQVPPDSDAEQTDGSSQ